MHFFNNDTSNLTGENPNFEKCHLQVEVRTCVSWKTGHR